MTISRLDYSIYWIVWHYGKSVIIIIVWERYVSKIVMSGGAKWIFLMLRAHF